MSDTAAREILIAGARALAHDDRLGASLAALLDVIAAQLEVQSAAVVTVPATDASPEIVATFGLGEAATAGLAAAMRNPAHPIVRTARTSVAAFDVLPTVPGGPVLRSHLPLAVTRAGADRVLGVLALAHDRPINAGIRPLLAAAADLAAVAIERQG